MVAFTVIVTVSVAASKTWSLNGTHALPFHQSIDCPPGPKSEMVMVTEPNEVFGFNATS